ncbi:MFS transporter [Glaciihabitans sp. dw_435]|uniref:MFS transporter n=1 Tax=Glaciihabitans sp. dw_435 TaxID=2720081 RepID=UPI001BD3D372|nr:MFS transporter [Glaciihabitans sp. dw_435]
MSESRSPVRDRAAAVVSSLRVRNYRLYFFGQAVSVAGTFMQTLALSFLTLQLTGSGTALGIVAGARILPFVLLGPIGGVIADRYDKRRLLYVTQSASAVGAVVFAVLAALGAVTYPVLIVLSLVLGCLTVFDNPARQSLIADLVPRETLANAVVLNSVSLNVARVLGSVIGGALVALVGIPVCFLINAASFVAVLVCLAAMRAGDMLPAVRQPRAPGQVRAGVRYALGTPELLFPLLMLTITGILAYEFPTTLPLLAIGAFGGTAATYGAMAAVMAGGAIIGGLIAASRKAPRRSSSLAVTAIGWGVAILITGLAPTLPIALIALAFVGYGSVTFNSTAKTTLQLATRPEMRGRVMALWGLAWGGSTVIGAPLVGWIAEEFGSRWGLIIGGAPTILLGLILYPVLRHRDRATSAPTDESDLHPAAGVSAA